MAERSRKAKDVGSRSPAKGEAKEQQIAGAASGPQEAQTPPRDGGKQPPQTSGRRAAAHEHVASERKNFEPEEDPSEQGRGAARPERIKQQSSQQGIGGRSPAHAGRTERAEEESQKGPPREGHTRTGRQHLPGKGDRPE
jgi:hypothetical protein